MSLFRGMNRSDIQYFFLTGVTNTLIGERKHTQNHQKNATKKDRFHIVLSPVGQLIVNVGCPLPDLPLSTNSLTGSSKAIFIQPSLPVSSLLLTRMVRIALPRQGKK